MDVEQEVDDLLEKIEGKTSFKSLYISCPVLCETAMGKRERKQLWKDYAAVFVLLVAYYSLMMTVMGEIIREIIYLIPEGGVRIFGAIIIIALIFLGPVAEAIRFINSRVFQAYGVIREKNMSRNVSRLDKLRKQLIEKEFYGWIENASVNDFIIRKYVLVYVKRKMRSKKEESHSTFLLGMIAPFAIAFSIAIFNILYDEAMKDEKLIGEIGADYILWLVMIAFVGIFLAVVVAGWMFNRRLLDKRRRGMFMISSLRRTISIYLAGKDGGSSHVPHEIPRGRQIFSRSRRENSSRRKRSK
ncbi:hypothetical protein NSQ26_14045 [Bacillus sp. FSL W7-1360]